MLRIYHNPKCSKSRAALARLEAAGLKPEIVNYLADPPRRDQLEALIDKLDEPASRLLREQPSAGDLSDADVIDILLASPELLQRPIIETQPRALIARPPELLDDFLHIENRAS